ncbi:hypothetical protein HZC32_03835 [Candidatus Woesearchaeota archaeon]|nr:hypothetical protein [Candidatus Woesearchaeota archaeon]
MAAVNRKLKAGIIALSVMAGIILILLLIFGLSILLLPIVIILLIVGYFFRMLRKFKKERGTKTEPTEEGIIDVDYKVKP